MTFSRIPLFLLVSVLLGSMVQSRQQRDLVRYVNPFVGTDAHGHTYPGATVPFGMVQLSPDTRVSGWDACAGYHYTDSTIMGFSYTHLSGTGVADYGDILVTPSTDTGFPASHLFRHADEKAEPGYYRVTFPLEKLEVELTASSRAGFTRYTFSNSDSATIAINLSHGLGPDNVISSALEIVNDHEVRGYRESSGWAKDQIVYFAAEFSSPICSYVMIVNDTELRRDRTVAGANLKTMLRFNVRSRPQVMVKLGLSTVSSEAARVNLTREIPDWGFEKVRRHAHDSWNHELGKIQVISTDPGRLQTFYTALYHVMLTPNLESDVDGSYRGMDGKIHHADFDMYTVFSLWDTFRAEHPLLTIIDPQRTRDFVKSLLAKYDESGALPVWELASNETWTMIGYHAVPVIVDAFLKGIRGFDPDHAYQAMQKSAMSNEHGLEAYRHFGYVPGDLEGESVSKTLEYSYDDWCIAQMATALGNDQDAVLYSARAQSYRNIFDRSTGFMRPKEDGCWVTPFDPTAVTVHFTEANAWQYSFFAPQDVAGLVEEIGGKENLSQKLDSLFYSPSRLTGREQLDISGLVGQYAQGNEPSHHVAFLYNYLGKPWKTNEVVFKILDSLYKPTPDGLCGNDDCGQMSAWYVMAALGIYQVCPGKPEYCITRPLFDREVIQCGGERTFTIETKDNITANRVIVSGSLNGAVYNKSFLTHAQLLKGGTLALTLGHSPSAWGTKSGDCPMTSIAAPIIPVPFFSVGNKIFADSALVTITAADTNTRIYYTADSTVPSVKSNAYVSPIPIHNTTTLKAIAVSADGRSSQVAVGTFRQHKSIGTLTLHTKYSDQYTGGGDNALIDGIRGGTNFRLGAWQGYEGEDLDVILSLENADSITEVSLGCLQDINSWIFFPSYVEFSFSTDGHTFGDSIVLNNDVSLHYDSIRVKIFQRTIPAIYTRYIRVMAKNIGVCPDWHRGAGAKAWLFVDELEVKTRKRE